MATAYGSDEYRHGRRDLGYPGGAGRGFSAACEAVWVALPSQLRDRPPGRVTRRIAERVERDDYVHTCPRGSASGLTDCAGVRMDAVSAGQLHVLAAAVESEDLKRLSQGHVGSDQVARSRRVRARKTGSFSSSQSHSAWSR
jgi:hypothetical protein